MPGLALKYRYIHIVFNVRMKWTWAKPPNWFLMKDTRGYETRSWEQLSACKGGQYVDWNIPFHFFGVVGDSASHETWRGCNPCHTVRWIGSGQLTSWDRWQSCSRWRHSDIRRADSLQRPKPFAPTHRLAYFEGSNNLLFQSKVEYKNAKVPKSN